MIKLLKIEWLKLKNYTAFKVVAILFFLSVFGINYIGYSINSNITGPAQMLLGNYFGFPNVWHTVSWLSTFTLFLPGLLMILLVTNEFTYKTHRQNIIDGWSRSQFINVKIVMVLIFSLVAALWVLLVTLLIGFITGDPFSFQKIEYIGYFFLQSTSVLMLALLISVLVKRAALAIALFIAYVYILENVLGGLMNYLSIRANASKIGYTPIGDVLPVNSADALLPFPFFRSMINTAIPSLNMYLLLGLVFTYLFFYIWFSRRRFLRSDL